MLFGIETQCIEMEYHNKKTDAFNKKSRLKGRDFVFLYKTFSE